MNEELKEDILGLIDSGAEAKLSETRGLKKLEINNDIVDVEIYLADPNAPYAKDFKNSLVRLVKINYGYKGIKVKLLSLKEKDTIFEGKCKFICIASGKGGVGKSTVTANLALGFTRIGYKVGIIDADIYGASIPNIMEVEGSAMADEDGKIIPFYKEGIEFISTDFFTDGKPLMWRGPLLSKMLSHYFYDCNWSKDLDIMLIDLPPGTGDVAIDVGHMVPSAKFVIVTTPHKSASNIAVKAGEGAIDMKMEVLGVVENMSYFINPVNNNEEYIFGKGGGKEVADKLNCDVLVRIPLGQPEGIYHSLFDENTEIGNLYEELAYKILQRY